MDAEDGGRSSVWPGGADDGYAVYAAITAVQALDRQGIAHPRCVGLVETCEESRSDDLLPCIDALEDRLATCRWSSVWTRAAATTTSGG